MIYRNIDKCEFLNVLTLCVLVCVPKDWFHLENIYNTNYICMVYQFDDILNEIVNLKVVKMLYYNRDAGIYMVCHLSLIHI